MGTMRLGVTKIMIERLKTFLGFIGTGKFMIMLMM
jgi:hypothetical protein